VLTPRAICRVERWPQPWSELFGAVEGGQWYELYKLPPHFGFRDLCVYHLQQQLNKKHCHTFPHTSRARLEHPRTTTPHDTPRHPTAHHATSCITHTHVHQPKHPQHAQRHATLARTTTYAKIHTNMNIFYYYYLHTHISSHHTNPTHHTTPLIMANTSPIFVALSLLGGWGDWCVLVAHGADRTAPQVGGLRRPFIHGTERVWSGKLRASQHIDGSLRLDGRESE
jgi:hypothetical protein